jgi:hypothetical protein
MTLEFSQRERDFVQSMWKSQCPDSDEIVVEIAKGGSMRTRKRSGAANNLLSYYSRSVLNSPGFFDYIDAYRLAPKKDLSTWNAETLSDQNAKGTLGAIGPAKFAFTKEYLASLVMRDAQDMLASHRAGAPAAPDSLKPIREFFDDFFSPMKFVDVRIDVSPFQYIIDTPRGRIDLDDLSSGEKEVLNTFIRFHQLNPSGAVILFDEADAHLHPDLERRYLRVLRNIGQGNQLWLTAHSPEMMIAAGTDALYTVLKEPLLAGGNQFQRVTTSEDLHAALTEIMGSRGLVSFNQRIVFIEGEESSADREVYEKFYPPGAQHISFVPTGNSAAVRKTAERVNDLLSSSIEFQHYFSIVDGDIDRAIPPPASTKRRLFQLPVYHVENLLLDDDVILAVSKDMLLSACPYGWPAAVGDGLKQIVLSATHMKPFAGALQDARLAAVSKQLSDSVFKGRTDLMTPIPSYAKTASDARYLMEEAVADGTWRAKCKGREVIKGFCALHGFKYEHFRNSVISKMPNPPSALKAIMDAILE